MDLLKGNQINLLTPDMVYLICFIIPKQILNYEIYKCTKATLWHCFFEKYIALMMIKLINIVISEYIWHYNSHCSQQEKEVYNGPDWLTRNLVLNFSTITHFYKVIAILEGFG